MSTSKILFGRQLPFYINKLQILKLKNMNNTINH